MNFSDFINSFEDKASRYFLARHLDSPLIADGLQDDVDQVRSLHPVSKTAKGLHSTLVRCLPSGQSAYRYSLDPVVEAALKERLRVLTPQSMLDAVNSIEPGEREYTLEQSISQQWSEAIRLMFRASVDQSDREIKVGEQASLWLRREDVLEELWWKVHTSCAQGGSEAHTVNLTTSLGTRLTLDRHKVIFHGGPEDDIHYGTFDMFLALKDCCGVRARSLLAADLFYPSSHLETLILDQIRWQEEWIRLLGNDGYEIAKQTESLSKAWLTSLTDPIFRTDGPFSKMLGKVTEKIHKLTVNRPLVRLESIAHLKVYTQILLRCDVQQTVELFGLQKLCMFPFIYAAKGGASAAKEALEDPILDPKCVSELRACWCSSFTSGYVAKHHRWPGLIFPESSKGTKLHTWYSLSRQDVAASDFVLSDWTDVRFEQSLDFDYHDNYLDLVDDKAISFYRDQQRAYWDGADYATSDRRLLLEMLSRERISIRDICEVVRRREVPLIWKIVSLYPKEKELKVNARMFSMMVLEMRTFFTCLEANLAKEVFQYLRSQTMTKDKVSITKRFFDITTPSGDISIVRLFFECDLSRWNLRWRDAAVRPIAEDLNDLFDTPGLFTYVHEFFTESVIVVRTPRLRPDGCETTHPAASDIVWYDHKGGFEGIAQKLWSICTYAMIDRGMRTIDCSYILIGQGDNQVLSVEVSRDQSLSLEQQCSQLSAHISSVLTKACKDVNQDLKPEECLESRTVLTYSKNLYVQGAEYYTSVKFAARLFAQTNNEIPSLSGDLSGLSSACLAAAEYNIRPLLMGTLLAFFLTREMKNRLVPSHAEMEGVDPRLVRSISARIEKAVRLTLFTPVHFGGFSIATPLDFMYRGGGDPAAKDWSFVVRGGSVIPEAGSCKSRAIDGSIFSDSSDPTLLFEAPYALPLVTPPSQRAAADRLTEEFITTQGKNKDVIALSTDTVTDYRIAVQTQLLSISPINPLLISEAYGASACAESDRLKRMFTATRTVQTASRRGGHDSSGVLLHSSGDEAVNRWFTLLTYPDTGVVAMRTAAAEMKSLSEFRGRWEPCFRLVGLPFDKIVGLESLSPALLAFTLTREPDLSSGVKLCMSPGVDRASRRGPLTPYLGAATQSKRSEHGFKIEGDSRASTATDKLSRLIHTAGMSIACREVFFQLSCHRTGIDPTRDELFSRQTGGTVHHRFIAARREMGSYTCGTSNLATWCFFITDEIVGVSGTSKDFAFMFQEAFTYALALTNYLCVSGQETSSYRELVLHLNDRDLTEVPNEMYNVDFLTELEPEESWSESRMIFDGEAHLRKLSGPVAESRTYTEISIEAIDQRHVAIEALRAAFSTATRLDGGRGLISRRARAPEHPLPLDLTEIVRLRLDGVITAAARAGVGALCYRWIHQLVEGIVPSGFALGIRQLSASYAAVALPSLDYAALLEDDSIGQAVLFAQYKHGFHYSSAEVAISAAIATKIRTALRQSDGSFGASILFASEPSGSGSGLLESRLGLSLYRYARTPARLQEVALGLRLSEMSVAFATPRESYRQRATMKAVSRMRFVAGVTAGLMKVLDRFLYANPMQYLAQEFRTCIRLSRALELPSVSLVPVSHDSWNVAIRRHLVLGMEIIRFASVDPDLYRDVARLSRGLSSPAVRFGRTYSEWYSLIVYSPPKYVHLIGVGNGVVALAALDADCHSVEGVDIGEEYNLRAIRRGFPPPAVLASSRHRQFSWSASTISATIRHSSLERSVDSVLEDRLPESSLVIIDVRPFPTVPTLIELLKRMPEHIEFAFCWEGPSTTARPEMLRLLEEFAILYWDSLRLGSTIRFWVRGRVRTAEYSLLPTIEESDTLPMREVNDLLLVISPSYEDYRGTADNHCALLCGCEYSRRALSSLIYDIEEEFGRSAASSNFITWTETAKVRERALTILDPSRLRDHSLHWLTNRTFMFSIRDSPIYEHPWTPRDIEQIIGPLAWLSAVHLFHGIPK
nr:RNA-dependent RNA polymerase [Armillaria gallica negative stranded RNA virus 1]